MDVFMTVYALLGQGTGTAHQKIALSGNECEYCVLVHIDA